jgi:glucose/arabinose dehydrogenase
MKFKNFTVLLIGALLITGVSCDDDDDDPVDVDDLGPVSLNLVAEGLTSPLVVVESPDNSGRLFIVDQSGYIYISKDGTTMSQPFLDISGKIMWEGSPDERGLLGLAFHPQFQSNGRFFIFYSGPLSATAPTSWDHTNHLAEYTVTAGSDQADPASERILLSMDHPQSNHNAGMLAFGNDGYLYISTGDGGGADDTAEGHVAGGNGQDITQNLLGSILRIDVNSTEEDYTIPADNPFVGVDGFDEIFAFGFRNPYRFSFDPEGNIIVADAGQELYEEIDLVEKGGNYGWNIKEGAHCFDPANSDTSPTSCASEDANGNTLMDPVIEFKNSRSFSDGLGNVSIGGYVYEGDEVSDLNGKYIFGVLTQDSDAMNGAVYAAERAATTWNYKQLDISNNPLNEFVLGFGKDKSGEVYVLTNGDTPNSGKVYMLGD